MRHLTTRDGLIEFNAAIARLKASNGGAKYTWAHIVEMLEVFDGVSFDHDAYELGGEG